MFRQYTTSVSATPDHIASRGAISMYCRPSRLSIVPQLGTSGGSPKPSMRINDRWRVVFRGSKAGPTDVRLIMDQETHIIIMVFALERKVHETELADDRSAIP